MALALSDLSYDLLTLVRTYDRANDFARAEEYRLMLDRVTEQEQDYQDTYDALDDLETKLYDANTELAEAERQRDISQRLLDTIAGIARAALDTAAERDDLCDDEAALLEALSDILSHADA